MGAAGLLAPGQASAEGGDPKKTAGACEPTAGLGNQANALAQPGARPMVMKGRTMDGYVYVDPPALKDRTVRTWVRLAVTFVKTLPPKPNQKMGQTKRTQK